MAHSDKHQHPALDRVEASLRHYAGEYGAHEHDHVQVLVGLAGRLELELDGRAAYVDASCGLIVPAGIVHGYEASGPAKVLVIESPVRAGLARMRRFAPPPHWKDLRQALDGSAAMEELAGVDTLLQRRPIDPAKLESHIDGELHGSWGTARLAALCQLSPQRFHARFVELTGMAPAAFVRRRRLDEAQRLLRAGLSLEAAALRVGYASASALAFALRRERGVGARELRG